MLAYFTPAVFLLASAVCAQTPSVVTFISITPTPSVEQIFSIQTIDPNYSTTACYEDCIMPPCSPCGNAPSGLATDSAVPLPSPISVSIPSGSAVPLPSPIMTPSGSMGIPPGETPIPSSILTNPPVASVSGSPSASRTSGNGTAPSAASSVPPQQSTAGASPSLQGDSVPFKLVMVVSGLALMGASMMVL